MTRDVMTILSQMRVTQLEELRARHEAMQRSAEDRLREERSVQDKLRAEIITNQTQIAGLTTMLQVVNVKFDSD